LTYLGLARYPDSFVTPQVAAAPALGLLWL
jgi:hypothetical protein